MDIEVVYHKNINLNIKNIINCYQSAHVLIETDMGWLKYEMNMVHLYIVTWKVSGRANQFIETHKHCSFSSTNIMKHSK
jgi:hypothetical protein